MYCIAPSCFCARRFAGRTARSTATGASSRTSGCATGRVVQRAVLYLGEINSSQELAWRRSIEVFDETGPPEPQTIALFPEDRCEAAAADQAVVRLRLSRLELRRPRQWGACWLALKLWQELRLDRFFAARLPASRKGTRWEEILFVLVAYRLIAPGPRSADRCGPAMETDSPRDTSLAARTLSRFASSAPNIARICRPSRCSS